MSFVNRHPYSAGQDVRLYGRRGRLPLLTRLDIFRTFATLVS